jgi:hypothetical protein
VGKLVPPFDKRVPIRAPCQLALDLRAVRSPHPTGTVFGSERSGIILSERRNREMEVLSVRKELQAGGTAADRCRELGVSQNTSCVGRDRYGGLDAHAVHRLRQQK